jgi:hypothetical protein
LSKKKQILWNKKLNKIQFTMEFSAILKIYLTEWTGNLTQKLQLKPYRFKQQKIILTNLKIKPKTPPLKLAN